MASELQVTTLRGAPTGANANQIVVPTGQTLTAPGHVIQMQHANINGSSGSTTSASFTDTGVSVNITPKFATSKILVIVHQVMAINPGNSHARVDFRCIEAAGSEIYRMDFHGHDGLGTSLFQLNFSGSGVFQCSSTNQLTFKTQAQKGNGTESDYLIPLWYNDSIHTIQALEIAQ